MTDLRRVVPIGAIEVASGVVELTALGLGSCVAIVLLDPDRRVGGLAHVLLPAPGGGADGGAEPGRYANSAVSVLHARVIAAGGRRERLRGWLVGGATMFANLIPPGLISIGGRNILAAREALDQLGVQLAAEAVGGDAGRSVTLYLATGVVEVTTVRHGAQRL